jgi:glycosyltransferase involved in cell wall biosynthesis
LTGNEIVQSKPLILRLGIIRLFFYLKAKKPDIIHILSAERFTISIYIFKFLLRCKIITTFHSVLKYEIPRDVIRKKELGRFKDYLWEWLAVKFSDKMIFLSQQHLNLAEKYYSIDREKITIIPNGVEKEFFEAEKNFKVNNFINIVFYNGISDSIDRGDKGVVKILNELKISNIRLFVIGKRTNFDEVSFNIEFVEPMEKNELIYFLKDKHILIKSPTFDSFSIFTAECMTSGLVVIISDNTGISSYIKHEINGFIYDYQNPDKMKVILQKIIYNEFNLIDVSKEAKKIFHELNWENISRYYLDCYKSLV